MKIAVLCIATNFKVRMKIGNKSLLMQEEKRAMAKVLGELEIWISNSEEELVPVIITCFDEIYEMSVQKHFLSFKNDFGFISESQVIRFGINSYPEADAYFIVSTSDSRTFHSEIFEDLLNNMKNNPNKIVISMCENKLSLPMAFPKQFVEPVKTMVDNENGRFILRSNNKYAINFEITDEMKLKSNFHKNHAIEHWNNKNDGYNIHINGKNSSRSSNNINNNNKSNVVIIRGGGRLASSIAITLHQFGYKVLITENDIPQTIHREKSFAQAVFTSDVEIEGIKAYLVSPNQIQIKKAWESKVIPVIIDPSVEVLKLFDCEDDIKSLYNDNYKKETVFDIVEYLKSEKRDHNIPDCISNDDQSSKGNFNDRDSESDSTKSINENNIERAIKQKEISFLEQYSLFALIDATSNHDYKSTDQSMAPIIINLRDKI